MCLFSIIIPVFQAEKYVDRCVGSVLKQMGSFEVILIDDGSTDNSLDRCRLWAKQDKRVTVYTQSNHGVSYTRNMGIEYANGDYVLFLDSDDELPPDTLSIYEKKIELSKEPDIVIGGYRTVLCRRELNCFESYFPRTVYNILDNGLYDCFWILYNKNLLHNIGTKIYKRQMLCDNLIRFDSEISICEDALFCLKAIKASQKVSVISDIVYIYNIQANKLSLNHIYRRGMYQGICKLYIAISELQIVKDERFYSSLYSSLIETLYNEFRNTIFCYNKINELACLYRKDDFINENFFMKDNNYKGNVYFLYENHLRQLYICLLLKYLYEKIMSMRIWSVCFDFLYYIYKKTIRNIIK